MFQAIEPWATVLTRNPARYRIAVMNQGRVEQVGTPGGDLPPGADPLRALLIPKEKPAARGVRRRLWRPPGSYELLTGLYLCSIGGSKRVDFRQVAGPLVDTRTPGQ
jgi:hypothetical protein